MGAGLRVLHERGFNGCGVQEITEAAGVPKGSFYNHFESKEDLACEVLSRYWQAGSGRRAVLSDDRLDPVERLRCYFRTLAGLAAESKSRSGCLIGNFSAELPLQSRAMRDHLAETYAAWTRSIEGCVRDCRVAGRLKVDVPEAVVASFVINAWEGAVLRSKVEQDGSALEQFEQVIFTSIFG